MLLSLFTLSALAVDLPFPRSSSKINTTFGPPSSLGAGGGGVMFVDGNWVGDKFLTGVTSVSHADLFFEMDDWTNGACPVGWLDFDVVLNGTVIGSFSYEGGHTLKRIPFNLSLDFAPVAGLGPAGDGYKIAYVAQETVCPGGGSYNYFPTGLATLL